MILGGKKYKLSPEEYIFGAITLYMDILNIFIYMLQMVNTGSGGGPAGGRGSGPNGGFWLWHLRPNQARAVMFCFIFIGSRGR